jgi:DNA helicase TIP49 (TBP-interacting protein)
LFSEDIMEVEEGKQEHFTNIDTEEFYSFESVYSETIYEHLREKEVSSRLNSKFRKVTDQELGTWKMFKKISILP